MFVGVFIYVNILTEISYFANAKMTTSFALLGT